MNLDKLRAAGLTEEQCLVAVSFANEVVNAERSAAMTRSQSVLKKIGSEATKVIESKEQEIVKLKAKVTVLQTVSRPHLRRTDIRTRHHPRR